MIELEVCINFVASFFLYILEFIQIKYITKSATKLLNAKNILLLLSCSILTTIMHIVAYSSIYSISVFVTNIIIYTYLFKVDIKNITIATSIFMINLVISEIISVLIFNIFTPLHLIETNMFVFSISNIIVMITTIVMFYLLKDKERKIYLSISKNNKISNVLFVIVLIIGLILLLLNVVKRLYIGEESIINVIIMILLLVLAYIYYKNKEEINTVKEEYDNLFKYIETFEDWIEKEQINRHEYKNQLAAIRMITKDKKVQEKIAEILDDFVTIDKESVNQLKNIPNGGLKGLLYYKISIAEKKNIEFSADVSLYKNNKLLSLDEKEQKDLCRLIGIYFDNAIEAALKTKDKLLMIEIYEIKKEIKIIISNSFVKSKNFDKRQERGVTSKGKGHGNGLYYAKKILNNNEKFKEEQNIIDNYYYQTIIIK